MIGWPPVRGALVNSFIVGHVERHVEPYVPWIHQGRRHPSGADGDARLCRRRCTRPSRSAEPDAGHDVELEKMLSYVEKYNNLESFEFDYGF